MSENNVLKGNGDKGFSRRDFVKYLLAGSSVSIAGLSKLNASIYQSITDLNQKYIQDEAPDGVYWDAIREKFMFQDGLVMMNNGTVGPMPKTVFNTLIKTFKVQATSPVHTYTYIPRQKEEIRSRIAAFINASPDEVAVVRNTTEGMNFVANGLDLKPGDEVLLSSMEHPGGTHPWKIKEARCGIKVTEVPIGLPPKSVDEFVGSFKKAITPKTRVISVSHTVYISGLISPLKELSQMAHEKGLLVAADSAHGMGMLDLDIKELGVDFLATSPYKWLGAPTGVGVFYVRKEAQDQLWPTITTSGWDRPTARKYETLGQRADALIIALGEAVNFQNYIGKVRIEQRIKSLAGYFKQELKKIPGAKLHTSEDPYISGGLTAFSIKGVEPRDIVDYVRQKYNIVIRTVGRTDRGTYGCRVSTHYYINHREIDQLLEGIRKIAGQRN
ncbi:MAG: aminotransferase class V-fold PLP-dependent enzyme [Candidatus Aminicenantes bacterium]|nr:aminotransferase class V-fold PLP-dependent enzyme [Candidatus Aminicenantes bacterium]HHF52594.1 aminotransferase class V-fold PLP-dependent enzyme [Candidatus Aminicenantes bacterium]